MLLEKYLKGEVDKSRLLSAFEDGFYDNVNAVVLSKNDPTEKLYEYGRSYFSNVNLVREQLRPIYVEKEILFKTGDYQFRGIIDLMYKNKDGELVILDHKTSEYPVGKNGNIKKSKAEMMDGYTKQLALYAHGVEQVLGIRPRYIGWNFIRANQVYKIELTDEMVKNTLLWTEDTIKTIYNCEDFQKKESYVMCSMLCDMRDNC